MSDIRTTPPILDGPLTVTLDGAALTALNLYRKNYHTWPLHPGAGPKGEQLNRELADTAAELAKAIARLIRS